MTLIEYDIIYVKDKKQLIMIKAGEIVKNTSYAFGKPHTNMFSSGCV